MQFRKKELRKQILDKRNTITKEEHKEKSNVINEKVIQYTAFEEANSVLLYAAFRSEVDTTNIFKSAISSGKKVYYPKVLGDEMEFYQVESEGDFDVGTWGILEPKAEERRKYVPVYNEKVCMVMPGAVFDRKGNRIGYGRGYYDKYLMKIDQAEIYKIGIGFECQVVDIDIFPKEKHDVQLDAVITEIEINICECFF